MQHKRVQHALASLTTRPTYLCTELGREKGRGKEKKVRLVAVARFHTEVLESWRYQSKIELPALIVCCLSL